MSNYYIARYFTITDNLMPNEQDPYIRKFCLFIENTIFWYLMLAMTVTVIPTLLVWKEYEKETNNG